MTSARYRTEMAEWFGRIGIYYHKIPAFAAGKYAGYYDRDQLYDLSKDTGEQNNLAGDAKCNNELSIMKNELKKYLDDLPGTFPLDNK